ncbi:MAG: hypothetical protein RR486_03085 [Clostridium sp.]|uniref:hypothetical protein n=1 Tax=Clostridium sp. TaxID=1506 RepID=UPI00303EB595
MLFYNINGLFKHKSLVIIRLKWQGFFSTTPMVEYSNFIEKVQQYGIIGAKIFILTNTNIDVYQVDK